MSRVIGLMALELEKRVEAAKRNHDESAKSPGTDKRSSLNAK
jgi:hypothetical protein